MASLLKNTLFKFIWGAEESILTFPKMFPMFEPERGNEPEKYMLFSETVPIDGPLYNPINPPKQELLVNWVKVLLT